MKVLAAGGFNRLGPGASDAGDPPGGHAVAGQLEEVADRVRCGRAGDGIASALAQTSAFDRVGDFLELTGDGVATWWITGIRGTWA